MMSEDRRKHRVLGHFRKAQSELEKAQHELHVDDADNTAERVRDSQLKDEMARRLRALGVQVDTMELGGHA